MYAKLTPQWAGTLLGLVQVACIPIPFVFYKWGERIRAKSPLIKQMRADQQRREEKAAAVLRRQKRKDEERGEKTVIVDEKATSDLEKEAVRRIITPMRGEKE